MVQINPAQVPMAAHTVLSALEEKGYESWIVGGWVRDALLGRPSDDVDICTRAHPDVVMQIFEDLGLNVIPTGLKHGTVTVVYHGTPVEITTFRKETGYSDSRHPDSVQFVNTIEEDLARRDFTVNALAYNPVRGIKDPFDGIQDLKDGVIRSVGDPYRRFSEDALRIIRAVRFACRLHFVIEPQTQKALVDLADTLQKVASERVGKELQKILASGQAGAALLAQPEVITSALPELKPLIGFDQKSRYHAYDVYEHTARVLDGVEIFCADLTPEALRWAALLHDIAKPECFTFEGGQGHFYGHPELGAKQVRKIMHRLALPKRLIDQACALIAEHDVPIEAANASLFAMASRLNVVQAQDVRPLMYQALYLRCADAFAKDRAVQDYTFELFAIKHLLDKLVAHKMPLGVQELAISGKDVMQALNLASGKQIGQLLQLCLEAVQSGECGCNKTDQIAWLETIGIMKASS